MSDPIYISVRDENGEAREYKIPTFGEFTLAEWKRLQIPANTEDGDKKWLEEVKRMTGIPLNALKRLTVEQFDKLLDAYFNLRTQEAERRTEVEQVDFSVVQEVELAGVKYDVPQDLEKVSLGQWIDLNGQLSKYDTEPDRLAAICGCMLVEQGKEYSGSKFDEMQALPVSTAMGVTAFFLGKSERLRTSIDQSLKFRVMSLLQEQGLGVVSSTTPTEKAGTT